MHNLAKSFSRLKNVSLYRQNYVNISLAMGVNGLKVKTEEVIKPAKLKK